MEGVDQSQPGQANEIKQHWETQPIDPKWLESEVFPPGSNTPHELKIGRGYAHFVLRPTSQENSNLYGFQQEVEYFAKRGDIQTIKSGYLDNPEKRNLFPQEFKIHLQPKRKFVPLIAAELGKFLQDPEVKRLISEFKVQIAPEGLDQEGQAMPEIAIYPNLGRDNAKMFLVRLLQHFSQFDQYGSGSSPRYNLKVSELIFLAQSSSDLKNALAKVGLLDEYFDKETGYAFMKGERIYWQDVIPTLSSKQPVVSTEVEVPELSPQEALKWNQDFLRMAMDWKSGKNIRWDDRRRQMAEVIQKRLSAGEPIDVIFSKTAANVRALRATKGQKP